MKKEHAEHNEEACDYLLQSEKFNDWVVTTAFYSALHYVHYEIFPMTFKGTLYENFNSYYDSCCHYIDSRPSKHQITIELVSIRLPNCNRFLRWLYDECMNARYKNYKVTPQNAIMAKKHLTNIKAHLNKLTNTEIL